MGFFDIFKKKKKIQQFENREKMLRQKLQKLKQG